MRSLSMVAVGLALAATTVAAEPLRLADTDLDLVTADLRTISVLAQIVQVGDGDGRDIDNTTIRILDGSDGDVGFLDARSSTNPEADDVDLAAPISTVRVSDDDPGNPVGNSDALIMRGGLSGTGVVVFDGSAVSGNDAPADATRTVSRQIVVRTSSTDNGVVVQSSGSVTRTGKAGSSTGASIGGVVTSNSGPAQRIGGVERSLLVRNDNASGGAGIRATSLLADNGNAGLSARRLDTGITAGGFSASAFAGGSATSMLSGSFN